MNLDELKKRIAEKDDLRICPICGLPYRPYRSSQRNCGTDECKKEYHRRYVKEYNRRRREENPELVREIRRKSMRKYRQKQRMIAERYKQLEDISDRFERQESFSEKVRGHGWRYGDMQAQKILETVPKIDVNLGGNNDNIHDKDDRKGSE